MLRRVKQRRLTYNTDNRMVLFFDDFTGRDGSACELSLLFQSVGLSVGQPISLNVFLSVCFFYTVHKKETHIFNVAISNELFD